MKTHVLILLLLTCVSALSDDVLCIRGRLLIDRVFFTETSVEENIVGYSNVLVKGPPLTDIEERLERLRDVFKYGQIMTNDFILWIMDNKWEIWSNYRTYGQDYHKIDAYDGKFSMGMSLMGGELRQKWPTINNAVCTLLDTSVPISGSGEQYVWFALASGMYFKTNKSKIIERFGNFMGVKNDPKGLMSVKQLYLLKSSGLPSRAELVEAEGKYKINYNVESTTNFQGKLIPSVFHYTKYERAAREMGQNTKYNTSVVVKGWVSEICRTNTPLFQWSNLVIHVTDHRGKYNFVQYIMNGYDIPEESSQKFQEGIARSKHLLKSMKITTDIMLNRRIDKKKIYWIALAILLLLPLLLCHKVLSSGRKNENNKQ